MPYDEEVTVTSVMKKENHSAWAFFHLIQRSTLSPEEAW
jgi:hypothetical protein